MKAGHGSMLPGGVIASKYIFSEVQAAVMPPGPQAEGGGGGPFPCWLLVYASHKHGHQKLTV